MDILNIRLTFLLYISRSGSTMLANQIAKHMPDVLVFPELDFVGLLFANGDKHVRSLSAERLIQLLRIDRKLDDIDFTQSEWLTIVTKCAGEGIVFLLTEIANSYARKHGQKMPQVVLFQRGTLLSVAQEIANTHPAATFIHIFRDPRAAISSIVGVRSTSFAKFNQKRMGRGDAIGLSKSWVKYTRCVDDLENNKPDNVLQIRYEDLCRHRDTHLQEIAEFLQVDYSSMEVSMHGLTVGADEDELHKHIDKAPMLGRLDAWREELPIWRGYLVEHIVGDKLIASGYKPHFSNNISTNQHIGYLVRGLLEHLLESVLWLSRRLSLFWKSPRPAIRMLKRKIVNRPK